jgi:hypothetical protein
MKRIISTVCAVVGLLSFSNAQSALDFDGTDDIVVAGNQMSTDLVGTNTFTVEAWVNSATTTGLGVIIGNYNYPVNNGQMQFLLRRDNDQYSFWIDDGDATGNHPVQSGVGTVVIGQWQHVAGVWDGSEIRIYLDGVLMNTTTAMTGPGFPSYLNDLVLGNNIFTEAFTGQIDNIRVWDNVRTNSEINNFMTCEVATNSPGLLASYHFNDGTDGGTNTTNTTLFDNTGNGYHGTLQNFALTGTTSNFTNSDRINYMSIQSSIGSSSINDRMYPSEPADFNGDGFDDILVTKETVESEIYFSDGLGNFEVPTPISNTINGSYTFAVGDIDNDGDIDFVNYGGTDFKVYLNDGSGTFADQTPVSINGTGNISFLRIADVNGDNLADIVIGNGGMNATDLNEIWENTGTAGNPSFAFLEGLNSSYAPINGIAVGDIDNDGDVDLTFGGSSWNSVTFKNDNNTTFVQDQQLGAYNGGVRYVDWNQDGFLDLMTNDNYNAWGVRVYYNNGVGAFLTTPAIVVDGGGNDVAQVSYADMNGDGFTDIITRNFGGNGKIFLNNGCTASDSTNCRYKLGPADNASVIGDFNGDGKPDVFCGARDRKSSASLNFLSPVTTPALADVTSTTGDEVCDGDQISIDATVSNVGTIQWFSNSDGSTQIATGSPYSPTPGPGTYQFYVGTENANGCRSLLDTVEVIVNENPDVSLNTTTSITELDCFGNTDGQLNVDVTLNGSAATATYEWDDASSTTTQNLTGIGAGTYNITVTDDNGCVATTSGTVTQPDLLEGITTSTAETNGNDGSIDLTPTGGTPSYSYAWTGPNGFTSTDQDPIGLAGGSYEVTITDDNGCTFLLQVTVDSFVGLEDIVAINFKVYPNPTSGIFNIETGSNGKVDVMSLNGKIVYSTTIDSGVNSLNVKGLSQGVYTIRFVSGNTPEIKKLVVR